ncbi:hypothetical protein [Nocardioides sp. cx-173]|uniref:hypothetical protein n=1 Tax=Nocardioides sp. cx-173 TaxID=2898796 RepID=UPI001E2D8195|nr:hypothetical protein [Nocardioides sp. cx-173]MCD4523608.1 hypothetical protein [Nocardioides sp. cx-173]UGB42056.1 hypothetical protein LQ940_00650 [Nocardioides sp. cx-173]
MSWWQEYQGFLVVGAFVALLYLRARVRRWQRRNVERAAQNAAAGVTWDQTGDPVIEKALDSLATVVHLPVDLERAVALLDGVKTGLWWKRRGPAELYAEPNTVAVLEPDGDGTRLALTKADDRGGIPPSEPDWRKLRRRVVAAAQQAGIEASEVPGPRLVRTPVSDLTGLSPAEAAQRAHLWRRQES